VKTDSLKIILTSQLRRYLTDQVRAGRYADENEVVREAIRKMQESDIDQFDRCFTDYPGAPPGEPSLDDQKDLKTAIKNYRIRQRAKQSG
jgi:Arc/MetJ-type ribon-helix-helix transcriptional regulator